MRIPRRFLLVAAAIAVSVGAVVLVRDPDSERSKLDHRSTARILASGTDDSTVRCIPAEFVREGIRWGDYTCMYYDRNGRLRPQSAIGVKVNDTAIVERTG